MTRPVLALTSPDYKQCREKPYYDHLLERISKHMRGKCVKPCRPRNYWVCNSELETLLPVCQNFTEEMNECIKEAEKIASKGMVTKPCTKVQYKFEAHTSKASKERELNQKTVEFELSFKIPAEVTVHEEYLIYDAGRVTNTIFFC